MIEAGQYITDGTVTWIVTDVRDGTQVGDIKMSPILRKGYVKANGALLTDASINYPRLVAFVEDNPSLLATDDTAWAINEGLYVYDVTNDTLRVPNLLNRVVQGGNIVEEKEAGLPNIKGDARFRRVENTSGSSTIALVYSSSGAFSSSDDSATNFDLLSNSGRGANITTLEFNASNSSSIYSDSINTVQPPAITLIPQIKY